MITIVRWRYAPLALSILACSHPASSGGAPEVDTAHATAQSRTITVDASLLQKGRIGIATVESRSLSDDVWVSGQVVAAPGGKAEIGALMTARVRSVSAQEGDRVRAGDILATLDAPDAARIFGELALARARRARAETVLAQEQTLTEQRATSARSLSEATSEADSARADELTAQMLLRTYNAKGTVLTLRAPIAGVIAQHRAQIGEQVGSGDVLFRIIDPSKLNIRADVPESFAEGVQIGSVAQVRYPASGKACGSQIVASTRSVHPTKRSVGFRLLPDATCVGLLEGGFVDIRLALVHSDEPKSDAGAPLHYAAVPRSAIVEIDGVPVAFRATPTAGQFTLTPVGVVRNTEATVFIDQGLNVGDQVAASGVLLLKGEWLRSRLE